MMVETEIWPNLLRACRQNGMGTALVNGRISSRSYPRDLVRPLFRRVLDNVDRFCMLGEESARRIIDMGADAGRVVATGSLKLYLLDLSGTFRIAQRVLDHLELVRYFRAAENREYRSRFQSGSVASR